ncbi:MAG: ATP-dependent DNA helicase [Bacteroidota bacterium]
MSKRGDQHIRKKHEENFEQELARLNQAQREAVETIEGPVLVVAGPGTGKTHILSARIGNILKKTDTKAHNILCLTYTDAGVNAMRQRLLHFIGPESHKVHIYTFHSFCNSVIQDNLTLFGVRDLEPVSQLERVEVIRDLIDGLKGGHPLVQMKGDLYFYERHLRDLFDKIKAEQWTASLVDERIDEYLENLKSDPEFLYKKRHGQNKVGDLRQAKYNKVKERMERLRAGAWMFPDYELLMRRRKRYDFADMIRWVVDKFRQDKDLLRNYQEQYLYVLVDEFQDTNGAQTELLKKLIDYWEKPNIFVVGDDDQSIYEFQGARVRNITEFHKGYDNIALVVLKENYRSSQHILDTAKELIENNDLRLVKKLASAEIDKNLVAANDAVANSKVLPEIIRYHNPLHEDGKIVERIESLRDEGVRLGEIAIIYAKHKQSFNIIDLLERKSIPYSAKRRVNVLEVPMIRNILTFLSYLSKEYERPNSGDDLLYRIMHFDFLGIEAADITQLAVHMNSVYQQKLFGKPTKYSNSWRDLIGDEARLGGLSIRSLPAILRLSKLIDELILDYVNLSLPKLFERLINRSGLLTAITNAPDKVWQVQVISTLFEFIRGEAQKFPSIDVNRLLDIFKRMKDNYLELSIQKSQYAEDTGVNLLTAHGAKGLEFKYVFIIDAVKDNWEPSNRTARGRFAFPDTLTFSGAEDEMEASRRLFYVAMTRAKERLWISFSEQDLNQKERSRAVFVDEILNATQLEIIDEHMATANLVEAQLLLMQETEIPVLESPLTAEELDALLENFVLSPTSLCRFLDCSLSFYFENVLHIPSTSSDAAAYGSAIHYALRRHFEKMRANKEKEFPMPEDLVRDFEFDLSRRKIYFSETQYKRRLELGRIVLPDYFSARIETWRKIVDLEHEFRNIEIDGVPVTGTVDKIEFLSPTRLHIVDYKTSTYRPQQSKPPSEKHPLGGDYWRQLVFYKILLENYRSQNWQVVSGEIDYVEPDKKSGGGFKRIEISLSAEAEKIVHAQIKETWQKIQNHEFFEGCGKANCKWCNFVNAQQTADSFNSVIAEEMDD